MTTWHKGPPPSIGWWPASCRRNAEILRWWNGKAWSYPAHIRWNIEAATARALMVDPNDAIKWTDRPASWPERSKT